MLPRVTLMVSLALAPTWKLVVPKEPSNRLRPPKVVVSAIRVSSVVSAAYSDCREARSSALLEPLADWRASSRMRCRMLVDSCMAPSAVWAMEMPSLAFLVATFRPLIWLVRRLEICRPAASSLALLIFRPLDRRCMVVDRASEARFRFFWVLSDATLVLTVRAMTRTSWCGLVRLPALATARDGLESFHWVYRRGPTIL